MPEISAELMKKVHRIQVRTSHLVQDLFAGEYRSTFRGTGLDFEDLRAYQPGDEVRNIDWNVTARTRDAYVKVYREERQLTVNLLVDLSASGLLGSSGRTKRELMAEVAAVLALAASRSRDRVGLLLFTDQVEHYVAPRTGQKHVMRLLRDMLGIDPASRRTDFHAALAYLNRVQPKKSVCFLISDFLAVGFDRALRVAARRHDLVAVVAHDPLEESLPNLGRVVVEDAETGRVVEINTARKSVRRAFADATRRRRQDLRETLKRCRVGRIELSTVEDTADAIHRFFVARGGGGARAVRR